MLLKFKLIDDGIIEAIEGNNCYLLYQEKDYLFHATVNSTSLIRGHLYECIEKCEQHYSDHITKTTKSHV